MPRPRKYQSLYGPQEAYRQSERGRATIKEYESSETRRAQKRDWARKNRGMIVDKRQWFIDTYGDIETALATICDREQITAIDYYYGLNVEQNLTQTQIGEILGKSRYTISDIIKKAKAKLEPLKQSIANNQN